MLRKYSILFAFILFSVIFTSYASSATKKQQQQQEEPVYVANFTYTPDTQAAPGSAGVTFSVENTILNYQPDTKMKLLWFKSVQLANLPEAVKKDISGLLAAKGFNVRGPFGSYDLIPYQDKKAIDLFLVPNFGLSLTLPDEISDTNNIKVEVTGRMNLELREIATRELMWSKNIPLTKFEVPFVIKMFKFSTVQQAKDWPGGTIIVGDLEYMEPKQNIVNELAKGLEKQYPDLMATISKLIDPEEMRIIRKQCQELKSKKGY